MFVVWILVEGKRRVKAIVKEHVWIVEEIHKKIKQYLK